MNPEDFRAWLGAVMNQNDITGSILGELLESMPAGEVYIAPKLGVNFSDPWAITKAE